MATFSRHGMDRRVRPKGRGTSAHSLGLHEGSRLKLEDQGGKLQAAPEPDPVGIELKDGFPVIRGGPFLTGGAIVQAIKADRDSRDERVASRTKRK
jgi:hypothetical protein